MHKMATVADYIVNAYSPVTEMKLGALFISRHITVPSRFRHVNTLTAMLRKTRGHNNCVHRFFVDRFFSIAVIGNGASYSSTSSRRYIFI